MQQIYTSILLVFLGLGSLFAQPVGDFTYTDCRNGQSRNLYEQLGAGRVVVIVASGIGCSRCAAEAPEVDAFATAQSPDVIQVWGAVNRLGGTADCPQVVSQWTDVHGWSDVFAFNDVGKIWAVNGRYPTISVIDPADSSVVYSGGDFDRAKDSAVAKSNPALSLPSPKNAERSFPVKDVYPNPFDRHIVFDMEVVSGELEVQLSDLLGNVIHQRSYDYFENGRLVLDTGEYNLASGYYFLQLSSGDLRRSYRLMRK